MALIVIDAGHGGFDNGAMYQGRKEKDDNLRLALAVGDMLKQRGYDVIFTRTGDEYQSPYEKAQIANEAGADYFISFHRNSGENDNTYNGVQTKFPGNAPGRVYPERACKQRLCRPWHRGENRACGASQDRDARSAH